MLVISRRVSVPAMSLGFVIAFAAPILEGSHLLGPMLVEHFGRRCDAPLTVGVPMRALSPPMKRTSENDVSLPTVERQFFDIDLVAGLHFVLLAACL